MYSSYTESAAQIEARRRRILARTQEPPVCICLERIGDNGPCPVHGTPQTQRAACPGAVVFVLKDGTNYCNSCGGSHE